ncbi:NYN domain-containing protein [Candidatus Dojkabacteria bacterium]|nr:NYN domain-containing protein [Candidatus Dojkabacteria bacterium]
MKRTKIYAFIDSQNLDLGVKNAGWNLDFKKFRVYLEDKYNVSKAYLFIGHVPGNEKLYTFLQEAGYILIFKPTLEFSKGKRKTVKGNVDAELVLHTMILFGEYDKAIIVTGDGDFYCLVEYLEDSDKLVKIITPNHKYSSLLRKYAEYITSVQQFREKVEYRGKRNTKKK